MSAAADLNHPELVKLVLGTGLKGVSKAKIDAIVGALDDAGYLNTLCANGSALVVELDARQGCTAEDIGSGVAVTRNGAGTIMSVAFAPNTVHSVESYDTEPLR